MKTADVLFENIMDLLHAYVYDFEGDLSSLSLKFKICDNDFNDTKKREIKNEIEQRFATMENDYSVIVSFYKKTSLEIKFTLRQ